MELLSLELLQTCRQIFYRNGFEGIFDSVLMQWAGPNDVLEVLSGSALLQFL